MTRRVQWSNDALADLLRQVAHLAADDPDAAARLAARVREVADGLGDYATGHPGRVAGTFEKSVSRLPYIIAYALGDGEEVVSILRVVHTARDWPRGGWPA